ncbi:hypothetical protein PUNSTDRAFT_48123 [Punctularia strigosozonata HHB-11173 SS5]|uniref:Uncharacterized protein n=1 Tax=Punctularia strigosozonata (strain HHB-11173) TaxID=741275 RepID=R7S0T2_PUNST|nr:uncharacterized protein PUNSTDRAFT_48123 [Punctularia strigosozonata HHB-11173 SS5]EIN03407.1 hypothetical protein PUNSTDRAFT_48123 [Punctularia strigosozonata HHB-11173 SS5]
MNIPFSYVAPKTYEESDPENLGVIVEKLRMVEFPFRRSWDDGPDEDGYMCIWSRTDGFWSFEALHIRQEPHFFSKAPLVFATFRYEHKLHVVLYPDSTIHETRMISPPPPRQCCYEQPCPPPSFVWQQDDSGRWQSAFVNEKDTFVFAVEFASSSGCLVELPRVQHVFALNDGVDHINGPPSPPSVLRWRSCSRCLSKRRVYEDVGVPMPGGYLPHSIAPGQPLEPRTPCSYLESMRACSRRFRTPAEGPYQPATAQQRPHVDRSEQSVWWGWLKRLLGM